MDRDRLRVAVGLAAIAAGAAATGACGSDPAAPASPPADGGPPSAEGAPDAGGPGPADAGPKLEWPNADSFATSDPWIAKHHDAITKMRPRILAVNFDDDPKTRDEFHENVLRVAAGINEGSRYHGYASSDAPPFLEYEVGEWVDLADAPAPPGWLDRHKISSRTPVRCSKEDAFYNFDYAKLVADLNVCDKLAKGAIHEVWIHMNGDPDPIPCPDGTPVEVGAAEILESKPFYDTKGNPKAGLFERCAGNGCLGEKDFQAFAACGRTVRVLFLNSTRGPGCAIHSAGHGYEWMARSQTVPELTPRFSRFANFDLKERLGLPFTDWYACDAPDCITFTGPNALTWRAAGRSGTIATYDQACGNVHFAPNARAHYDESDTKVLASCEHFGLGDGEGGKDAREPFDRSKYERYQKLAPDCGGAWQVYWRQSFPGLGNAAKDEQGKPMRNWWPYIFY
jgi:hypothetical protein